MMLQMVITWHLGRVTHDMDWINVQTVQAANNTPNGKNQARTWDEEAVLLQHVIQRWLHRSELLAAEQAGPNRNSFTILFNVCVIRFGISVSCIRLLCARL